VSGESRRVVEQRTDPRLELIVFVTPGVESSVRLRLQAVAAELVELTGDVVVIQRHELATVVDLHTSKHDEPS
jgi:ABC-type phosphonate transport system ATPase subunit